jgi:hypothetical protein
MTSHRVLPTPTFSSPLATALGRFLETKRAAGYRYRTEAHWLRVLDRFLTQVLPPEDPMITLGIARAFVARQGNESETTRHSRVSVIREVCRSRLGAASNGDPRATAIAAPESRVGSTLPV